MILKQSIRDDITVLASAFGLEEVEDVLAVGKYTAYESSDVAVGLIGTIYEFKIEVLTGTYQLSETLCLGCSSFAIGLVKLGYATTFSRTKHTNENGDTDGYLVTFKCKTFI